jgi:hypothetical protein
VSRRRSAVEINSDEDQNDSRSSKNVRQLSVPLRKHRIQEDDNSSSEGPPEDIHSGDFSEEDDDADLQKLGDEDLASVFASEVIVYLFLDFRDLIFISAARPLVFKVPPQ